MRRVISSTHARASGRRIRRERGQLEVQALELGAADVLELLPERDDRRDGAARTEPRAEPADFLGDDGLGAQDLARAAREVFADRRLQVVDVVEEDLLDFTGRRLDVARHGDVDDEERTVAARPHHGLDVRLS